MKTSLLLTGIMLLLTYGNIRCQEAAVKSQTPQKGEILISCTPDLYGLTSEWASEFTTLNPEVKIKIARNAEGNAAFSTGENLAFISNKARATYNNPTNWEMVVGRDIVVPVVNIGNPYLNELIEKGISQEKFVQVFSNPDKRNWGTVLGNSQITPMHIYVIDDESVKEAIARFLHTDQLPVEGIDVQTKTEVIKAVQNDPNAIGFCKVVNIIGLENQGLTSNLKLLPIDKNDNGTIDYMEKIYSDINTLLRGVWIGKYPKTLYRNIYAVSKTAPANEAEIAFLSWVLTDGQRFMNENGYCDLSGTESQSQLAKLTAPALFVQPEEKTSSAGLIILIVALLITAGLILVAVFRRYRKQAPVIPDFNYEVTGFNESDVKIPKGIYFDRSHTWAFMEKDGNVTVGIDDFLQHITGPINRVDMKQPGEKISKGELLFSIVQSGKQLSLYTPVSGTIRKQNEALVADASKLNSSPYSEGWVYSIEPANWFKEIQFMEMAEKYRKWISTEFSRIKDFLAATLKPDSIEYAHEVLQDGGVLKEGILADFGPEVWEDFQTSFLDNYK